MSDATPSSGDEPATVELFRHFRRTDDRKIRDRLVIEHRSIAEACARRFANRGEPLDDLVQVGLLGLVKAVERFDPEQGIPFAGFAVPTVTGEIRRHFRDATWAVHVPRRAKDLHVKMPAALERLRNALGRPPTPAEIAEDLGVTVDDVLSALDAGAAYRTQSTDTPNGQETPGTSTGQPGTAIGPEDRVLLEELLVSLPERERRIVWLRFFEDMSQTEIADIVGTSQVHVSRLLRKSLRDLRARAGSLDG